MSEREESTDENPGQNYFGDQLPADETPADANVVPDSRLTQQQTYNVVSDTVTGANVRLKDNLIQACVIFVCLVLGAVLGAVFVQERVPGALVGGFIGLVVGLFGSGIFLMVFRMVMHMRGRHD